MLRAAIAALVSIACTACTALDGDPYVFVSSTPAGAEILVDDQPTGLTTPALLDLGGFFGDDHRITLQMDGRDPESRWVRHHTTTGTSRWLDGAEDRVLGFTWPIWWTLPDFFVPFKASWRYHPHELHAVLYELGQAPVSSTTQ